MRPVFPQERLERLKDRENQKFELSKKQKWSFIFFMLNSSALYQIGVVYAGNYFNNSRLPFSYHLLIAIATSIAAALIGYLTKNKSHRFNKWLAAFITLAMVLVALFIPRPF